MKPIRTERAIVPAEPGYSAVEPLWEKDGIGVVGFTYSPVIAWFVDVESLWHDEPMEYGGWFGVANPVTVDGLAEEGTAIRYPDGRIAFPHDCTCENEAIAIAYFRAQQEAFKKRLARLQAKEAAK